MPGCSSRQFATSAAKKHAASADNNSVISRRLGTPILTCSMRRWLVLVLLAVLMVPATASAAPNVVVIETDDQTVPDMVAMPQTRALIGAQGTRSEEASCREGVGVKGGGD